MKFIAKLFGLLVVLLIVMVGVLLVYPNQLIQEGVETFGSEVAKTEITLESVDLSVFSGKGSLRGLKINNPEPFNKTPHAFSVGAIDLELQPKSLMGDVIRIHLLRIVAPEISYERQGKADNISALQKNIEDSLNLQAEEDSNDDAGAEKKIIIEKLVIQDAKVNVYHKIFGDKHKSIELLDITLNDIGEKSNGATAVEVGSQIMEAIKRTVTKQVLNTRILGDAVNLERIKEQAKEQLDSLKDKAQEQIKSLQDKLNLGDETKEQIKSLQDKLNLDEETTEKAKDLLKGLGI